MSDTSHVAGYTKYHDKKAVSQKNIRDTYPYALPDNSMLTTFHKNMENSYWKLLFQEELGFSADPGEYYEYHVQGERHHFHGFYAKKK